MTTDATPNAAALLASPVRRRLVEALALADGDAVTPGLTAAELGTQVGLHVTTVRFHLDQLVAAGMVESAVPPRGSAGRPRKVYSLAPGSLDDVDARAEANHLRLLSGLLASTLTQGVSGHTMTPAEAGRRWAVDHVAPEQGLPPADTPGRWLGKLAQMIDVLQEWGYTPELKTSDGGRVAEVTLANCPFLDLARANPAVVCGIHRGLIAGSLAQLGESGTGSVSSRSSTTPPASRTSAPRHPSAPPHRRSPP